MRREIEVDIQHFIDECRNTMLTTGHVMPMIYLELSKDVIMIALDIISDTQSIPAQSGILGRQGWEMCKKYPGQTPQACCFYAEGWRSRGDSLDTAMRPVRDPKREEILLVSMWRNAAHPQSCIMPVIRDHKKRVIDIGPVETKLQLSFQLAAFLQGVQDAQKPDEEVFDKMEDRIANKIAILTPEKLAEFLRIIKEEPGMQEFMQDKGYI